jgi:hypothetical protein
VQASAWASEYIRLPIVLTLRDYLRAVIIFSSFLRLDQPYVENTIMKFVCLGVSVHRRRWPVRLCPISVSVTLVPMLALFPLAIYFSGAYSHLPDLVDCALYLDSLLLDLFAHHYTPSFLSYQSV